MGKKIAAFDIFGTSFGFENLIQVIDAEFGNELKQAGTTAAHVMMSWFYATQRDFTYLSICGSYTPIGKVFVATLPRSLAIALDPAPQYPSTSRVATFDSEKCKKVLAELKKLPARPGLIDAFETLWKAGFEVYAVSNGAKDTTRGLLAACQPQSNPSIFSSGDFDKYIISCDEVKKAKPSPDVYEYTLTQSGVKPDTDICWFVAAHNWDLLPARKAGFKTAYVTFEEIVACEDIFGKPDITEDGLAKVAKAIVATLSK